MKIALIGSTGSIGRQVCNVVRRNPELFSFSALVAGSNQDLLLEQIGEFRPSLAALANGTLPAAEGVKILGGEEIAEGIFEGCDVAFIAASGFSGLEYTLKGAKLGKKIALANKESLVCGGELVMREKPLLAPVDSEHSALFQCLNFRRDAPYRRLVLTASGGPFFSYSREQLASVTAKDALKHPTWNMGSKITIDSSTLLNKGYEVIEAKWLYGADFSQIEAIVHPESIVHSLVDFADGATMAQLGYPTMEVPIQLALTYPERMACAPALDLTKLGTLHFYPLPREKFPCFDLAVSAGKRGGTAPAVLNGAAEIAVYAFLKGGISFMGIAETIEETLNRTEIEEVVSFEQLKEADRRSRETARNIVYGK